MKLALVSPLPPLASPAADLAASLLPHLRERAELHLLPHEPAQADGKFESSFPVEPIADLPHMLQTGVVDLPVYLVADDLLHAHQLRFIRENPGLVVLLTPGLHRTLAAWTEESGDLEAYRALLVEEHGPGAADWPERFLWRVDRDRIRSRLPLLGPICGRSLGVFLPRGFHGEVAERLRARYPDLPVQDFDLGAPGEAAAAIVAMAEQALATPRAIEPLLEPDWPEVEVVIVGYNCRKIIEPGLRSIANQDYPNLKCLLVDNASVDGTGDFVAENFPDVRVVQAGENLGFAGGNNLAFFQSTAKYVVLFNQDAVARRDMVRELVRVAERDPKVAAVGAKMLMMRCPTIINSTGIVMNEGGFAVDRQIGERDENPSPVPDRVFGVCGGAKLIRTSVLHEIGGFDDTFFMYCEDVDLCWRMRLAGYEVLYAPLAVVHHDWHGDLDPKEEEETPDEMNAKTLRRRSLCERNRMLCVIKNTATRSLPGALRKLRRYDKARVRSIESAMAAGGNREYLKMVRRAIKGAWTYCGARMPQLFARRRRVQKLRRVPDSEIAAFIDIGFHEPSHVGDLSIINDRLSARPVPRVQMGVNDQQALGPGWYDVERSPGQAVGQRWTKAKAWLYLETEQPSTKLCVRADRGLIATSLRVRLGTVHLGEQPVEGETMHVMEFPLPEVLPPRSLVEVEFSCDSFRPSDTPGNEDDRELGIHVAEVWLE